MRKYGTYSVCIIVQYYLLFKKAMASPNIFFFHKRSDKLTIKWKN